MTIRRRVAAVAVAVLVAAGLGGEASLAVARADSGSRVRVVDGSFTLDGRPWWPVGFDAYELGTNWSINEGCGAQVDVDRYFGSLPPNSVTRVDVFAPLARNRHYRSS